LQTNAETQAFFSTNDPDCPIWKYEILKDDEEAIPSDEDLYTILNIDTRTSNIEPPDAVTFKAGFFPVDKVFTREVLFKMTAYNYIPKLL
jgi:hypothetical protein